MYSFSLLMGFENRLGYPHLSGSVHPALGRTATGMIWVLGMLLRMYATRSLYLQSHCHISLPLAGL